MSDRELGIDRVICSLRVAISISGEAVCWKGDRGMLLPVVVLLRASGSRYLLYSSLAVRCRIGA